MSVERDRDRHAAVQRIFELACTLPDAQREALLEQACAGDGELRAEILELLAMDADRRDPALERPGGLTTSLASSSDRFIQRTLDELRRLRPLEPRYEPLDEIARGGMGRIVEVWEPALRRPLAMKMLLQRGAPDSDDAKRVSRLVEEAQITAQLDHPGVVSIHELGVDEAGRPFFTMERVGGEDLSEAYARVRRREPGWTLARVVGQLERVCQTVAFAHAKGVVHRDLKPANVRVGEFGEVYVMDWGIAKVLGRPAREALEEDAPGRVVETDRRDEATDAWSSLVTREGTAAGTPSFMSPEQARGEIDAIDARTDVYAVGAMLYALLAGCAPYRERDEGLGAMEIVLAAAQRPPARLAELAPEAPPELVAICEKAMAREPTRRYESLLEMATELRAWLEGRVVSAYETGALAELKKWIGRNRAVAGVSIGFLLSLVIGTVVSALLYVQSEANARGLRRSLVSVYRTTLDRLVEEELTLWPPVPELVPQLQRWIAEAEGVLADANELRLRIEAGGEQQAVLERLTELEQDLLPLTDAEHGLLDGISRRSGLGVRRRLELASTVEALTITGDAARRAWREARDAGLELTPQLGLLPLGRDPQSGLWEFAQVQTGEIPRRDDLSGALELDERSAIVFVLVPAGTARVGAQSDPSLPNHDPFLDDPRRRSESPVQTVELQAFLLSKYELTQGQWLRLTGENPSFHAPGRPRNGQAVDLRHPVERVSWSDCVEVLGWIDLQLPTESQWEYAARAGLGTPWWTGAEPETLAGRVNLADRSAARVGETWAAIDGLPDADDGWAYHAPAGALPPNPYGLHEVLGNVFEWCRDERLLPGSIASIGLDGERIGAPGDGSDAQPVRRVVRGGAFNCQPKRCSVSFRMGVDQRLHIDSNLGVRPVRRVVE